MMLIFSSQAAGHPVSAQLPHLHSGLNVLDNPFLAQLSKRSAAHR